MRPQARRYLIAAGLIVLLRAVAGAVLPLSADEAYYWLWSQHLAAGYYDHPPAIAYVIRAGTLLFGATSLGVRFGTMLLSGLTSLFVWRAAVALLKNEADGARAILFFNLTLMAAAELLAATPDAPALCASAGALWALSKVVAAGQNRWWVGVGIAMGLALLSKYTAFFLGLGILAWLLFAANGRAWLRTPWPWAAGFISLAIFVPNIVWNSEHSWATFAFQFGRVGAGHVTLRFLLEFLGTQLLLASPFLLVLASLDVAFSSRDRSSVIFFLAALIFPSALYFLVHALHDRVQGNWPSFLYPMLAIAAADAWRASDASTWRGAVRRISRHAALPVAGLMLAAAFAQTLFGLIPIGRADPASRLLAFGMPDVANQIAALAHGRPLVTTDYESTAWLDFNLPGQQVIELRDGYRYPDAQALDARQLGPGGVYVVEDKHDQAAALAHRFGTVQLLRVIDRKRAGVPVAHYRVYALANKKGPIQGRAP